MDFQHNPDDGSDEPHSNDGDQWEDRIDKFTAYMFTGIISSCLYIFVVLVDIFLLLVLFTTFFRFLKNFSLLLLYLLSSEYIGGIIDGTEATVYRPVTGTVLGKDLIVKNDRPLLMVGSSNLSYR